LKIAKESDSANRVFKNNIAVRSGTKKSSSWLFFKINNGMDQNINIVPKAYVTTKNIRLLTPAVFVSIMEAIRDQKLNCDIKIFQKLADQGAVLNDQIVIHGNTKSDMTKALAIAQNILAGNFLQGDIGYDSPTQSYSEIIAQKIKTEVDSH
jgi:hypothetical protein